MELTYILNQKLEENKENLTQELYNFFCSSFDASEIFFDINNQIDEDVKEFEKEHFNN